jgi:hypothetical protein
MREGNCVSISCMGSSFCAIVLSALLGSAVFAQTATLVNPDFEQGTPGVRPLGWLFGFGPDSYFTLTTTNSCSSGSQCGLIQSNGTVRPGARAFLYQYVDARPYRGMKFRFRAAVRAQVSGLPNAAALLVRVHRDQGGSCFFDNMAERRITAGEWAYYEIAGDVCKDANDLELGMQLWGTGSAWLDDVSLDFSGPGSNLVPKTPQTSMLPRR